MHSCDTEHGQIRNQRQQENQPALGEALQRSRHPYTTVGVINPGILSGGYICCLFSLGTLNDLESHFLAFLERFETVHLN